MTHKGILRLRRKLKLTQQELADKIGVTRVTVLRWEKNHRTPHPIFIKALQGLSLTERTYR